MLSLVLALALGQAAPAILVDPNVQTRRVTTSSDGGVKRGLDVYVLNPSSGAAGAGLTDAELRATAVPVNQTQWNGVAALTGNGVTGTGSPRVTIASDNTAFSVNATLQTGANVIGSLAANQSVNTAQMNGVAVTMGNGIAGTGVQRVTLASDTSTNTNPFLVQGGKTTNTAAPGATNIGALPAIAVAAIPTLTEGNQVALSMDLTGAMRTRLRERATYSAGLLVKTATAAGTGVWFSICGSATKTVRIQRFTASVTVATTAVYADVILRATSTATSAGTATALVRVPHDSNSAAATVATPNYYTVLATAGTVVGTIGSRQTFAPITATPAMTIPADFSWVDRVESEAPVLRGTAQCLIASFGTTTTNAPTIAADVTWTEE